MSKNNEAERLERAIVIQKRALEFLRIHGEFEDTRCYEGKVLVATQGQLHVVHHAPYSGLPEGFFPYGVDIWWDERQVFEMAWELAGEVAIYTYLRGDWEHVFMSETDWSVLPASNPPVSDEFLTIPQ